MNERHRLDILRRYEILDTPTEKAFDDIAWLAARICGASVSAISLIDVDRLWTKAVHGMPMTAVDRAGTFCGVVVQQNATLVVPDASKDPRFRDFPITQGPAGMRSYLGAPLIESHGYPLGTLCVMDAEPREYTTDQLEAITRLAGQVMRLIDARIAEINALRLAAGIATQNAIVLATAQGASPEQAVRRCLTEIVSRSRWTAARYLRVDDGQLVDADGGVCAESSPLRAYVDARARRAPATLGLAGEAARTFLPAWVNDVRPGAADESLRHSGVRSALALPVVVGPVVIGVFEFFSSESIELDEADLASFQQIATQIADCFERQRTQDDLFTQKEFLNAVLENLADGIVACDADGNLTLFNDATRELHGLTEQALPPEQWSRHYNLLRPDGKSPMPMSEVPLMRAFNGEVIHNVEMVIAPHHAAARRVLSSGRAMYTRDGRKLGAVVAMTDITERVRAESAQRELVVQLEDARSQLEQRVVERTAELSSLSDSIPQIVWQTGPDGALLYLNRKFEDYTGLSRSIDGFVSAIHPEDVVASETAWRLARASGDVYQVEVRLRVRTVAYRWFLSRGVAQRSSNGQIVKWFGTTTDIHETKETEAMLSSFFSLPGVMLALTSKDGAFTRVNGAWTETLGYQMSQLMGRTWTDFIHADDRDRVAGEVAARARANAPLDVEFRFCRRDGTYAWLNWTSSPRDGVSYCVARDISASKDDQNRLRSVFNSNLFGIFFWDAAGPIANANDTFLDVIGYSRAELERGEIDWSKITPPEGAAADAEAIKTIRETGMTLPYEKEFFRKDGARVPVLIGASSLPGSRDSGLAFIIDMRKQRATENRFTTLVERSPFPTIVMDRAGHLIKVNQAWRELWGIAPGVTETAEFQDYSIFADQQLIDGGVIDAARRAMAGETTRAPAFYYTPRSSENTGRARWIESYFAPLTDVDGQETEIIGMYNDVTERVEAERDRTDLEVREQAAIVASKMKSEFLANMSHEIRTPINGVIGMTNLLTDTTLTEEQREYAFAVKSSADSLLTVINDILDFSKIESGKFEFDDVDFDLIELIDDVERSFTYVANTKKLKLVVDVKSDLPRHVRGDAGRLRQVFNNLVSNAIKFTPAGRVILRGLVRATEAGSYCLRFEVEDSGIGIPPASMDRMFKAFSQADSSTSRRFGGSGLGLSISKHLVERMRGRIGVESTAGVGSTFWFEVLLDVGAVTARPTRQPTVNIAEKLGRKFRILLAEDNIINQKIAMKVLDRMGLRCHAVGSGREALDALREFSYDLILMDCQMPEMDGYEATGVIRRSETLVNVRDIPIIAMTANALKGDRERCLEAGMTDYITKPVDVENLTNLLIKYLGALTAPPAPGTAVSPSASAPAPVPVMAGDAGGNIIALDLSVLEVLRALDEPGAEVSLTDEIIRLYVDGGPSQLTAIERAYARGDVAQIRAEAHSLKSASSNVGALRVADVCLELERLGEISAVLHPPLLARLRTELLRVYPDLERQLTPAAAG